MATHDSIKISFILICYNQVNEIDQALASIFSQKLDVSYEVIVSDDGSDDGTLQKIHAWQQKYPDKLQLLVHPRVKGQTYYPIERITHSIACALKAMRGDYFCLCDGDDYYVHDQFAALAIEVMEKHADVHSVVFDCEYRFKTTAEKIYLKRFRQGIIKDQNRFIRRLRIHSGSHVFRNPLSPQIMEKILSSPLLLDHVIVPFFIQHGTLYYIPQVAYSYRAEDGLWSQTEAAEQAIYTLMIGICLKQLAPQFRWDTLIRGRKSVKLLYKKAHLLKKDLNKETFNYLQKILSQHNDRFFHTLLNWPEASLADKSYAKIYFIMIRLRSALERVARICLL